MSDGSMEAAAIRGLKDALTGGPDKEPDEKLYVKRKKEPHRNPEERETERRTSGSSDHFYILQDNYPIMTGACVKTAVVQACDVTAEKLAKWRNSNTKNVTKVSATALFQELMDLGQFEKPESWEEVEEGDEDE